MHNSEIVYQMNQKNMTWFFSFLFSFLLCANIPSCLRTSFVDKAGLKLLEIHWPLPPEYWDSGCAPSLRGWHDAYLKGTQRYFMKTTQSQTKGNGLFGRRPYCTSMKNRVPIPNNHIKKEKSRHGWHATATPILRKVETGRLLGSDRA